MKRLNLVLVLLFASMVTACGYNSGVRTPDSVSYVYFTGNAVGTEVVVGSRTPFIVDKLGYKNVYEVSPGKQRVTIRKNGKVLVDRVVLLGDGQDKEFNVPN
ncbi:hypothetical protein [Colwellia sp. C1TZA3]|uniref:hypothetical protein n=1 Tax=Colwellia sp. C1TZA3 TaxID=2508879 RepID=UPI0011BA273E|nr:hypothetical protein [Colwellia sp. C1TZA3]TWX72632.1 hypothetical protein ESZ39_07595 [Colwellia sp. C1TZA3]